MNHKHTDKTCQHDLKLCAECGVVYCAFCLKEWTEKPPLVMNIPSSEWYGEGVHPDFLPGGKYHHVTYVYTTPPIHQHSPELTNFVASSK